MRTASCSFPVHSCRGVLSIQSRTRSFSCSRAGLNALCSFCPHSPSGSVNNSVLYLLRDLLLIINTPPSVSECDYCNHVPFKLMNFLQHFANVNQVIAQMSPRKKKMFFRNVDQRVEMPFLSHAARGTCLCPGENAIRNPMLFDMLARPDCVGRCSFLGEGKKPSPKGDVTCAGRTWELVSEDLALCQLSSSSHITSQSLRVFICKMGGRTYRRRSRDGETRQWA